MSRLVLRFTLGVLFVLVTTFLVVAHGARSGAQRLYKRYVGELLTGVSIARERLAKTPPSEAPAALEELRKQLRHPVALLDPRRDELPAEVREGLRKNEPRGVHRTGHGWAVYVPVHLAGAKEPRVLRVGPTGPVRLRDQVHHGLVALMILGVVVLTGVGLAWPLVKRLRELERTADRITAGNLDARAEVAAKDAVGRLAARFNVMADRVQELLVKQQGLLEAVSHELRTPVARLRFGLEMLADEPDAGERGRRLEAIGEDLDELEALVDEILRYLRTEGEARAARREPVAPAAVAEALAARLGELRPGIAIHAELPDVTVSADPRLFQRALGNVLDNALRQARAEVRLSAAVDEAAVELRVDDDGPGIPEADRERVFEPFVRLDRSRSRETGGAGLGLALVQRILRAHGGEARVEASPLGGARLVLRFPREATAGGDTSHADRAPRPSA